MIKSLKDPKGFEEDFFKCLEYIGFFSLSMIRTIEKNQLYTVKHIYSEHTHYEFMHTVN